MNSQPLTRGGRSDGFPTFGNFYRAINKRDPFPWQRRLASKVISTDRWPREIGIPTGLGKTSCLDIAIWWLASQAHCAPSKRKAPTRIWWVVNRRLLVDTTYEHAKRIREIFCNPENLSGKDRTYVEIVADRLRSLSAFPQAEPLEVIRLRGGIASERPIDASQPAILLSTVPMYGSRVLFRGYGSSKAYRVVDAAMAGVDSLVFLDEAHLASHLKNLFTALGECFPDRCSVLNKARSTPMVISLTATGDINEKSRFMLDDEDRKHPIVRERLGARKPLTLTVETRHNPKHLVKAASELIDKAPAPATCLVFANTPRIARAVYTQLVRRFNKADVLLLTGRIREREAEQIRKRILDQENGMSAGRDLKKGRTSHLVVVATQTLEVGADIDAEYLVTEACGVRALTQRLGRLNRLGKFTHSRAVYVHMPPKNKGGGWPVYGEEPAEVLKRLQSVCSGDVHETASLSPESVAEILGPPSDDPGRAPEILPGILWEWVKTSKTPEGEAPVEPYFSGIKGAQKNVTVIWRIHLPKQGERLWPRAKDREAFEVPIGEFRDALDKRKKSKGAEVEVRLLDSAGVDVSSFTMEKLHPGSRIVLPTDCGFVDEFGWNPECEDPVPDVSLIRNGLPLDQKAIVRLCGARISDELISAALQQKEDSEDVDVAEQVVSVQEILKKVTDTVGHGWLKEEWSEFISSLDDTVVTVKGGVSRLKAKKAVLVEPIADLDERSLSVAAVELQVHCREVAARARDVASRIGLPSDLLDVVEWSGLFHDLGKADRRFQRLLDPEGEWGMLLAKSGMPRSEWYAAPSKSDWPRGGRHEVLSARLARAWLEQNPKWKDQIQRDLFVHLVMDHHSKSRPFTVPVADKTLETVSVIVNGECLSVPAKLSIVDWHQPSRFRKLNKYFGPWNLALLETILIRADHRVSAEGN